MVYKYDFAGAARRNFHALKLLCDAAGAGDQPGCKAVAAYLSGLAGEMALKQMMKEAGVKEEENRKACPYYKHLPELQTSLRDKISGRKSHTLSRVVRRRAFFPEWQIKIRYASSNEITDSKMTRWKKDAQDLIQEMGAV